MFNKFTVVKGSFTVKHTVFPISARVDVDPDGIEVFNIGIEGTTIPEKFIVPMKESLSRSLDNVCVAGCWITGRQSVSSQLINAGFVLQRA